jgi:Uma2 family endonuclease
MAPPVHHVFTFADYVRVEEDSPIRHEFLSGRVWAMAGGSARHAAIAARVIALLTTGLRGRPCEVFTSDLRIRVVETGLGTYPDASVVCGALDHTFAP